jgi:hypothetical protein
MWQSEGSRKAMASKKKAAKKIVPKKSLKPLGAFDAY